MPAVKYQEQYTQYAPQPRRESQYKTSPIKKEVVKVKIDAKKSIAKNPTALNFVLLSVVTFLAICFVVVYSIVALCETKLTNLHTKISELNYENIELENKLENVKSFYSVDTKVSNSADFEKAKNVLELNHVNVKTKEHYTPKNKNLNTVTGF